MTNKQKLFFLNLQIETFLLVNKISKGFALWLKKIRYS